MKRKRGEPLPVMPEMCGSCILRDDGKAVELAPGRLDEIRGCLIEGRAHICHHAKLTGSGPKVDHACRGGRDWQLTIWHRLGWISEPTDEALAAAMNAAGVPAPTPPVPGRRSKVT